MSYSKPLSYDSLKTVLQHMGANTRFHVAECCPTIRKTDKVVPLKIDFLCLGKRNIEVNDANYKLGCFRKYPKGVEVPKCHQSENDEGGSYSELDKYGAPETNVDTVLTPGDVFMREPYHENDSDQDWIDFLEKQIQDYQKYPKKSDLLRDELTRLTVCMQSYINRRDNILPPYKIQVQLSVDSSNSIRIYRYDKIMQLDAMMKQLTTFLFGGRKGDVKVKTLKFGYDLQTVRLPQGLKFHIRNLFARIVCDTNLTIFDPIIDEKSNPLEVLDVSINTREANYLSHPLSKTAKKLILLGYRYPLNVSKLPNFQVHLAWWLDYDYVPIFESVLREWTDHGREIGSCFSFELKYVNMWDLTNRLMRIAAQFQGKRMRARSIKVPLDRHSEIHITFDITDNRFLCGNLKVAVAAKGMKCN